MGALTQRSYDLLSSAVYCFACTHSASCRAFSLAFALISLRSLLSLPSLLSLLSHVCLLPLLSLLSPLSLSASYVFCSPLYLSIICFFLPSFLAFLYFFLSFFLAFFLSLFISFFLSFEPLSVSLSLSLSLCLSHSLSLSLSLLVRAWPSAKSLRWMRSLRATSAAAGFRSTLRAEPLKLAIGCVLFVCFQGNYPFLGGFKRKPKGTPKAISLFVLSFFVFCWGGVPVLSMSFLVWGGALFEPFFDPPPPRFWQIPTFFMAYTPKHWSNLALVYDFHGRDTWG